MKFLIKSLAAGLLALPVAFGTVTAQADEAKLESVLAAQPENIKARYQYRHPKETLMFFGVEPGMTVADTLAGEYYSRILLPYLGQGGKLIGVSYSLSQRAIDHKDNAERMERYRTWPDRYVSSAEEWRSGSKAATEAYLFGGFPDSMKGTVDVFLMFRAAHHLHKYEDKGNHLSKALADAYAALKPGGVLGIVQHRAPEASSDEWAKGFKGYVKESAVIKAVKEAGFEFVAKSELNANPKDQPGEADVVWRLPPVNKSGANDHIGESDRMTLKFRKPA